MDAFVKELLFQPKMGSSLWTSSQSFCYLNPRLPQLDEIKNRIHQIFRGWEFKSEPSVWLMSSGTTLKKDIFKVKIINKKNFLAAAQSFNEHFHLGPKDKWLRALPVFHVGGLAIHARSFLSGAEVEELEDLAWNPDGFYQKLVDSKITFCSLVPTQLFDLVERQLSCPPSVRVVLVGGAALSASLKNKGIQLGWPLYETFGMTETSSMVASQNLNQLTEGFFPLPRVQFHVDEKHRLLIQAPGRLDFELTCDLGNGNHILDFRQKMEIPTQDLAQLDGQVLKFLGREQDVVKVGGELVSLFRLQSVWDDVNWDLKNLENQSVLSFTLHERLENQVILVSEIPTEEIKTLVQRFNERVLPFERIRQVLHIPSLPRNSMGKIQRMQLQQMIQQGDLHEI